MSRYFIDRPIFAWVLAIVVMLFGLIAIRSLPIAQFPALAPPAVAISAVYPGADAATLDKTTTQIIEQQLKGIDHLRYFSSQSSSSGQRHDHPDLRAGHQPGHRAGPGPEQGAGGAPAAAAGSPAAGRPGGEVVGELRCSSPASIRPTIRTTSSTLPT